MIRVPVVSYDNKPLMPTKSSRARKWVKQGKAVGRWSDVGIYYVQLLEPSGEETQPVVVGVDPGKNYAGIGVQFRLRESRKLRKGILAKLLKVFESIGPMLGPI